MPAAEEDRQPVAGVAPGGQPEVHPGAHAAAARRRVQIQAAAHARRQAVGPDDQRGAADLTTDAQPDGAAAGAFDPLDLGVLEDGHAGRGAGGVQQRPIELQAPLPQRDAVTAKRAFGGQAEPVVAHRLQGAATDGGAQAEPIENRHTGGQDPLTARLLAREGARIVDVDLQPGPPQQQRQRGARRAGPGDRDVYRPGQGTNLGLSANACR